MPRNEHGLTSTRETNSCYRLLLSQLSELRRRMEGTCSRERNLDHRRVLVCHFFHPLLREQMIRTSHRRCCTKVRRRTVPTVLESSASVNENDIGGYCDD